MSNILCKFYNNANAVSTFTLVDYIALNTINANALFIDHTIDTIKSSSYTLPFYITVSKTLMPVLNEIESVIVAREEIDFAAHGPNYTIIKNIGKDIGKEDYKDYVPLRQSDLPKGFIELRGQNV